MPRRVLKNLFFRTAIRSDFQPAPYAKGSLNVPDQNAFSLIQILGWISQNRLFCLAGVLIHEACNPLGWLGSMAQPMLIPFRFDKEAGFLRLGGGIEIADAFYVPAIPALAGISHYNAVKGAPFCSTPRQSNRYHNLVQPVS